MNFWENLFNGKSYVELVKGMICEMCGRDVPRLHKVMIEGAILNVCDSCARFGVPVEDKKEKIKAYSVQTKNVQKVKNKKEDLLEEEFVLVENYGTILKNAREKMNLTLEDAAKKLLEKKNVLSKIERQEMRPDKNLIKKLEKFYNVKITEKPTITKVEGEKKGEGITLGDLIKE